LATLLQDDLTVGGDTNALLGDCYLDDTQQGAVGTTDLAAVAVKPMQNWLDNCSTQKLYRWHYSSGVI